MLPLLVSVALVSFAGAITPGPILAVTLAKGCRSPWAGFHIAAGHILVEIAMILVIYFGVGSVFENNAVRLILSLLGGSLIIWLGISMFRSRFNLAHWGSSLHYNSFVLGILTTVFNPMFLLWWVTIGSMFIMRFREFGILGIMAFILAVETPNLVWYPFASIMTYRTRASTWGQKSQPWILTGGSLLLVGFGIWFLLSGIQMVV